MDLTELCTPTTIHPVRIPIAINIKRPFRVQAWSYYVRHHAMLHAAMETIKVTFFSYSNALHVGASHIVKVFFFLIAHN